MRRLLLAFALLLVTASSATAAPVEASISVDQAGPYALGDVVSFTSAADIDRPLWETVRCHQGGALVLLQSDPVDTNVVALGPTDLWQSGGASCVASLEAYLPSGRFRVLASVAFDVEGP